MRCADAINFWGEMKIRGNSDRFDNATCEIQSSTFEIKTGLHTLPYTFSHPATSRALNS